MWILRLGTGDSKLFFGPFSTEPQARRYLKLCSSEDSEVSEVVPASCPDCMGWMPECGCEPRQETA
jgi:hypothetical protein